jgi:hypothetical protein
VLCGMILHIIVMEGSNIYLVLPECIFRPNSLLALTGSTLFFVVVLMLSTIHLHQYRSGGLVSHPVSVHH